MIDERSSSSILLGRTCTLVHHLSLGSSMVKASHRSSLEGWGFDPRLGLRNRFLRIELDERSSIIQDISKLPHFQNIYISIIYFWNDRLLRLQLSFLPKTCGLLLCFTCDHAIPTWYEKDLPNFFNLIYLTLFKHRNLKLPSVTEYSVFINIPF